MSLGIFHSCYALGPGKVLDYLIMGLNENSINYKLNEFSEVNLFLQKHKLIEVDDVQIPNLFLGPNVADLPIFDKLLMQTEKYKQCIVPSNWLKTAYSKWIPENKIITWNVGIDFNKYNNFKNSIEYDFLIYYKRRPESDLEFIINFLQKKQLKYKVIKYGYYNDDEFRDIISKSKYGFVINGTETQGIAIQEMMSCDLPLIVWDVAEWLDRGPAHICAATSVPYFDGTCGETFYKSEDIDVVYEKFINNNYSPRNYILDKCNYIIQSKKLYQILNNV